VFEFSSRSKNLTYLFIHIAQKFLSYTIKTSTSQFSHIFLHEYS
jgi:hypothetical protein